MGLRKRTLWAQCAATVLLVSVLAGCGDSGHHREGLGPLANSTPPTKSSPTASSSTTSSPPASTATTTTLSPPGLPAPAGVAFGINVNRLFNDGTYSPEQIDAQLTAVRATGVTVARSDALWEVSEPHPPVNGVHTYDWRFDDAIAGGLAAHGLSWLPIVDYTATWNQSVAGQDHSPPASDADYAAYAAALARRYGPGGAFWAAHPELTAYPVGAVEIWNEPDSGQFWVPGPDPAAYAALYTAARDAIASAVPTTRVIVGGLTNPTATLPAMLAAQPGLAGHVDGVAVHPYGSPLTMLGKLRDDRRTLTGLGMASVPLYVTEFGWVTHPRGALSYVPARRRPLYIRSALTALGHLDCGIAAVVYYTWITPEHNLTDREDWFGLQAPDGRPGLDTQAFVAGVHAGQAPGATIDACGAG